MSEPTIEVRLDDGRLHYSPGETLAGEFYIDDSSSLDPKAVEVSVLWYTEGQGDEDLAVHYFDRMDGDDGRQLDVTRPQRFSTELPASPLSYDGIIVKLRWCVRVRLFPSKGKEVMAELPFQLGDVATAEEVPLPEEPEAEGSEAESETM